MKALRYTSLLALPIVILGMILIVTGCGGGGGGGSVMNGGLSMLGVTGSLSMHFTFNTDTVNRRFAISSNATSVNIQLTPAGTSTPIAQQNVSVSQATSGVNFPSLPLGTLIVTVQTVNASNQTLQAGSATVNIAPGQNQAIVTLTNAFGNFDLTGTFKFASFDSDNGNDGAPEFENADGTITFDGNGTITNVVATDSNSVHGTNTAQFLSGSYTVNASGVFAATIAFAQNGGSGSGSGAGTTTFTILGGVNSSLDTITGGLQITDADGTRQGLMVAGSAVASGVGAVAANGFSDANVAANLTGAMVGEDSGQGVLLDRASPDIPNTQNGLFVGNSNFIFNEGQNGTVATDLLVASESPAPSYAVASDGSFSSTYILQPEDNSGQSLGLQDTVNTSAGTLVSSGDFMSGQFTRQGQFAANGLGIGALVNPAANATNANLNGVYNFELLSLQNAIGDTVVGNIAFDGKGNIIGGVVVSSGAENGGNGQTNTQTIPATAGGYTVNADGSFTATFVPQGTGANGTVTLTGFISTLNNVVVLTFVNVVLQTDHPVRNTPHRAAEAGPPPTVVQNFGMGLMTQ